MASESLTRLEGDERRLGRYLRERAAEGEFYFKSKFIAGDVGLSTKEIGALLSELRQSTTELTIDEWGYANATTWRVVPATETTAQTESD
jgi:hypothetical protein